MTDQAYGPGARAALTCDRGDRVLPRSYDVCVPVRDLPDVATRGRGAKAELRNCTDGTGKGAQAGKPTAASEASSPAAAAAAPPAAAMAGGTSDAEATEKATPVAVASAKVGDSKEQAGEPRQSSRKHS